jgi:hypothetical protein
MKSYWKSSHITQFVVFTGLSIILAISTMIFLNDQNSKDEITRPKEVDIKPRLQFSSSLKKSATYFLISKDNLGGLVVVDQSGDIKDNARMLASLAGLNVDFFFNEGASHVLVVEYHRFEFEGQSDSARVTHLPVYDGYVSFSFNKPPYSYRIEELF